MKQKTADITTKLGEERIGRLLVEYSAPAIVGTMVTSFYSVIDRIFIGQGVGALAISGLAVTFPVLIFLQAFGMLVGAGASARISISLGRGDKEHAEKVLGSALLLTFIIQIPLLVLAMVYLDPMLQLFGASKYTLPYAKEFLQIMIPGNLLITLGYGFNNVMRSSGYPKKAMYTMIIGTVTNVILAPVFIFWLKWGIRGAAIASVVSMAISTIWVMSHFFDGNNFLHFKKGIFGLNKKTMGSIVSIGLSPFLMQLASCLINVIMNLSFKKYGGDMAIGAFGITNTLVTLIIMFIVGLNQGMQPVAGYNYGARKYGRVIGTLKITAGAATVVSSFGAVCAILIPGLVVGIFTGDKEMVRIASHGLSIQLISFFLVGSQVVIANFFQCIGMAFKAIFLSLTRQFIFLIPGLFFFPPFLGLKGVWVACPVADCAAFIISLIMITREIRKFRKQMALEISDS